MTKEAKVESFAHCAWRRHLLARPSCGGTKLSSNSMDESPTPSFKFSYTQSEYASPESQNSGLSAQAEFEVSRLYAGPPSEYSMSAASSCSLATGTLRETAKRLDFDGENTGRRSESERAKSLSMALAICQEINSDRGESEEELVNSDEECELHEDEMNEDNVIDMTKSDSDAEGFSMNDGWEEMEDDHPTSKKSFERRGSASQQTKYHEKQMRNAFADFKCNCKFKASGDENCLEQHFTKPQLRKFHHVVFGDSGTGNNVEEHKSSRKISEIKAAIHRLYWELKEPLRVDVPNPKDHKFAVPVYKLDGKAVCKEAFQTAVGGSNYAHREALHFTLKGIHPEDKIARKTSAEIVRNLLSRQSSKTEWAVSWWKKHLYYQDFLPNECRIQYRGPAWKQVHQSIYKPEADLCNMALKRTQWFRAKNRALEELKATLYVSMEDTL